MDVRKFSTKQSIQWIKCGWRLAKKRLMTWLTVSLILSFIAVVLSEIPVIGEVVGLFLFPIVLCSSIIVADRFNNPEAKVPSKTGSKRTRGFMASVRYSKDMLFSAFGNESNILPLMGMAAGMMVFGIVIKLLMSLVGGSAINAQSHFWQLSGSQFANLLAANTAAYVVYAIVAMCFFYALPLMMLRDYETGPAVKLSLKASLKNFVPFISYLVVLATPMVITMIVASVFKLAGFVLLIVVGAVVWMLFINSLYCSYRLTLH